MNWIMDFERRYIQYKFCGQGGPQNCNGMFFMSQARRVAIFGQVPGEVVVRGSQAPFP